MILMLRFDLDKMFDTFSPKYLAYIIFVPNIFLFINAVLFVYLVITLIPYIGNKREGIFFLG